MAEPNRTEPNKTEPNKVEFHERVDRPGFRSMPVRFGIVAGSALLVVVGAVSVMGASSLPSTAADPAASVAPGTEFAPSSTRSPDDAQGRAGVGRSGGEFERRGFRDVAITAINGSEISLKTDDGWTRTMTVGSTTKITKGGATIALADLAVGDLIVFRQQRAADGTFTVTAVRVVLPMVVGKVSAVDGTTIAVSQRGGTTATIHVGGSTTYRVDGQTGATRALSDIKVGMFVVAEGTKRADGSLDASAVRSGLRDGPGHGPGHFRGPGGRAPGGHGPGDNDGQGPNANPAPSVQPG